MYTKQDWKKASDLSIYNKDIIDKSDRAACYYCVCEFKASDVVEFVDEDDNTGLCPHCGIDAVLGDATGLPIFDIKYLTAMHKFAYTRTETELNKLNDELCYVEE